MNGTSAAPACGSCGAAQACGRLVAAAPPSHPVGAWTFYPLVPMSRTSLQPEAACAMLCDFEETRIAANAVLFAAAVSNLIRAIRRRVEPAGSSFDNGKAARKLTLQVGIHERR